MSDARVVLGGVSLTRLEGATLLGAAVGLVGMALPWLAGPGQSATGFTYGRISPVLAAALVLAGLLTLPDWYPTQRAALVALDGVTVAAWGTILVLGIPASLVGVGVYVTTLGGLVAAGAGYTALVRRTSTVVATAVVCGGSLAVVTATMVALVG